MKKNKVLPLWLLIAGLLAVGGCASLPDNTDRTASYAYTDTAGTSFGQSLMEEKAANPEKSGFVLLGSGLDAFVARAVLAHVAEKSIDAQYYLIHNDLTGKLFMDQLLKAADRGVRVRLLVDDMGLEGRDLGAAALDSHPNVEVRIFNPFSRKTGRIVQLITRLGSVTRRMHNKSFTVDNQVTILGGRNIGDEYFEAKPDLAFADLDVMAVGPVVSRVSGSFDKYWNSALAYPVSTIAERQPTAAETEQRLQAFNEFIAGQVDSPYLQALKNSDLAARLREDRIDFYWGTAEVVFDQPEKITHDRSQTEYHLSTQLSPYFKAIDKELLLFSPYFVPGKEGTVFLTELAQRGLRVRVLTNSLSSTDVGLVHSGYIKYREKLLRGGVELYELNKKLTRKQRKKKKGQEGSSKASLHTKSFVFDREKVFIGSLNLDPRSVTENTEIGVVLSSTEMAEEMSTWFDENIEQVAFRLELKKSKGGSEKLLWHGFENGMPRTFTVEPYTSLWRRFSVGFMRLLPIESQL
jgi:putative cardiolipin synthase